MEYYSPSLFRALNGVFCIYKPAGKTDRQILNAIKMNLSRELNKLPCRPPRLQRVYLQNENKLICDVQQKQLQQQRLQQQQFQQQRQLDCSAINDIHPESNETRKEILSRAIANDMQDIEDSKECLDPVVLNKVAQVPDLADHPLVIGPRYIEDDFNLKSANPMKKFSSGVTLVGISNGVSIIRPIVEANFMRVYHVSGKLGIATQDFTPTGRIIEQSTYGHVNRERIDRVIAGIQAGHQRHMFTAAGVDLRTEEAYELACKGLLRPVDARLGPVIYGMRCIHYCPPDFTLEIHAINETCSYLMLMVHDLGLELRTNAVCTQVRRIRHGRFTLRHSLLYPKHTQAKFLVDNIQANRRLIDPTQRSMTIIGHLPTSEFEVRGTTEERNELDFECVVDRDVPPRRWTGGEGQG